MLAALAIPAFAAPDGPDWTSATDPMGCLRCHFDSPDPADSEALSIEGLPKRAEPGQTYALTLVLADPALRNAGFMLSVTADNEPAGVLDAVDDKTETEGAKARQTEAGSLPAEPGRIEWRIDWTAPAEPGGPVTFDLWGNAGNDDRSPFGDRLHRRSWQLAAP